jgi:hypothetical protein
MARAASTGAKMALLPCAKPVLLNAPFVPNGVGSLVLNTYSRFALFGYGRTGNSAIIWMVAWRIVFRHAHPKRSFSVSDPYRL